MTNTVDTFRKKMIAESQEDSGEQYMTIDGELTAISIDHMNEVLDQLDNHLSET